jgi:hypothetical protein
MHVHVLLKQFNTWSVHVQVYVQHIHAMYICMYSTWSVHVQVHVVNLLKVNETMHQQCGK